jgi:hypothetical protein
MSQHVAVAIVGYRNAADIARCLGALANSSHTNFEVVICENGGSAAFDRLQQAVPDVLAGGQTVSLYLAPSNLGYAGGVNYCMARSPAADAWWVLNPDTKPESEALAGLVSRMGEGDCEAVGGTLYRQDGTVQGYGGRWRGWLARAESIGMGARVRDPIDRGEVEAAQSYILGASLLIGRRFLETVGPMREDYFLYVEEVEWCLRGRKHGMRLGFAPSARVLHEQGGTTGSADAIRGRPRTPIYLDERNKLLVTRDCFPSRLFVAAGAALCLLVLRYGRAGAWRQMGYAFAGWWAGVRNTRGRPANLAT